MNDNEYKLNTIINNVVISNKDKFNRNNGDNIRDNKGDTNINGNKSLAKNFYVINNEQDNNDNNNNDKFDKVNLMNNYYSEDTNNINANSNVTKPAINSTTNITKVKSSETKRIIPNTNRNETRNEAKQIFLQKLSFNQLFEDSMSLTAITKKNSNNITSNRK